ncbi:hypothetical protein N7495_000010 [Penicillium taxi]|uniref:uncharacterized protein n=1 Tax=Penicillium taxi TaxID=168475 RepID=UPI002545AED0|nr:uncharacterized protein N7495_000010 [Penicillium taxi]KAJ5907328.1 hypothetical protein N7495_000010 [Penicillium taxi]
MVLDEMLYLNLDRPSNLSMVVTPPAENDPQTKDSIFADDPLRRIYRLTPTPTIVLDGSLRILEVSDSHRARFHHDRSQLIGSSIDKVAPEIIPVSDMLSMTHALDSAIATRTVQVLGSINHSLRITPIWEDDNLIYILLEVHDVKRENTRPKLNHERSLNETYKILIDTVKDYGIFMLDTGGHIMTWNSGAAILKGYTADEVIGQHFSIFYGREDRQKDKPARELEVCLREGKVEDEGWRYRKDGSRFWANVMVSPIYQSDLHIGFVKVTRDLTERKAAEARLIDAFEESSKLKTEFLANMSHELRTPMNGMFLALTMLTRTELNDDQREFSSILEDSTSILLQVINDILDYSKLSSGSFSLNVDVLDVPSVVSAVIRNCQSALKPSVVLTSSVDADFPQNLKGDPLRFRQVLQNLVSNAVKFTEEGHIHVISSFQLNEADHQSYDISVQVVDTGIGIPEEVAGSTLFTPFTRFADTTTRQYQGTGLGLSICKSLAELMDGAVGFHPNPERPGSVFWIKAKVGRIGMPSLQPRLITPALGTSFDPSKLLEKVAPQKQILLVEDNKVNQIVMIKLLDTLGFGRVDAAWDGAEAVRMVKQKPFAYNVILMDISMPIMDGMKATEHIRQINNDVPIIALTGNALKGDAEIYLAKGMNDYIAKPLHRRQLVDILWKWCGS